MVTKLVHSKQKADWFIISLKGPKWESMRATLGKFYPFEDGEHTLSYGHFRIPPPDTDQV